MIVKVCVFYNVGLLEVLFVSILKECVIRVRIFNFGVFVFILDCVNMVLGFGL